MLNSGIYFTYTVAIVTKMAAKIRFKIEKSPFWNKFEVLGDRFLSELDISTAK